MRARPTRLATSEVMKMVLPDRDSPVTPRRITGSKNASETVDTAPSTPRVNPSAMSPRIKRPALLPWVPR